MLDDKPFLHALSSSAMTRIGQCVVRDLGDTAWACSPLLLQHGPLLSATSARALPTIAEIFDAAGLTNTVWSCSPCQYVHYEPLMEALSAAALRRIS